MLIMMMIVVMMMMILINVEMVRSRSTYLRPSELCESYTILVWFAPSP